jgi:hypothetical protein
VLACVILWCSACLIGSGAQASQQDPEELYAVAIDRLASGKPVEAIPLLEEVMDRVGRVTDVLALQLGNAHARADDIGMAILWYARALRANPQFGEARQNFGVLMRRTGALEFETGWPAALGRVVAPVYTAGIAAGLFWLAMLIIAWRIRKSLVARQAIDCTAVLILPLCLLIIALMLWKLVYLPQAKVRSGVGGDTIVVEGDASLWASPDRSSVKLIDLPPGSQLQLDRARGEWSYVQAPGELYGWVRSDRVASIAAVQ